MGTTNLSDYDPRSIPDAVKMKFGIVVSDWNRDVTWVLLEGAEKTLRKHGVADDNIIVKHVPGSFELTSGAKFVADFIKPDAVICLGCVIRGETPHFTFICQGVTQGITQLNLDYDIPFIFGVLTTDTHQQAVDRAGGIHGNKGDEAAITAIKMVGIRRETGK
ncbi:MAG: 6,7-dimethyl-8-ribityllumazine synthase [Bacteroidetes bacterium RBG_13_44_24]|nr:MAG: 6,7-dimethyl-8-ribityllumazine synthase [Bacteroidetes bacterium RBG_13_44_24]